MKARKILVLNGPNLDMLGSREPEIYGRETLEFLESEVRRYGAGRGVEVSCYQSNSEGKLVDAIHAASGSYDAIVYNPGAHTHYSYTLRDAVASIDIPVVEVHLSDIDEREPFRKLSVIAPVCVAQVKGMGVIGYCRAIDILCDGLAYEPLGEEYAELAEGKNMIIGRASIEAGAHGRGSAAPASPAASQGSAGAPQAPAAQPAGGMVLFGRAGSRAQEASLSAGSALPDTGFAAQAAVESRQPGAAERGEAPSASQVFAPEQAPSASQVASQPQGATPNQAPASGLAQDAFDATAPFAGAVAAVDAGLLSFERQALVRRACERLGVNAILVRDTSNVRWVTAFDGVFDEERAHALLIAGGRAYLHTDSRYANAVRAIASRVGSDVIVNDDRVSHAQFAYNVLTENGRTAPAGKLGIEDTITYAEFVKMVERFKTEGLAPTTEVVLGLRAVKDAGEITRMKAAQAITDAAFAHIVKFIRPGMTEREVQLELEGFMVRHGAEGLAFRSIVATGENGADPHAIPGNTRLEAGQCVVIDFGAKAYGYCSDMTRTVFLGQPEGAMASAWETVRRANEKVEAMLKPGVTGAAAHQMAEMVLDEGGFGGCMGHGLGHGVGIDVHEMPSLNPRNASPLVEGNVVTVEPGIYLPGRFGIRLEDFGVITPTGFDVFTQTTHEMIVL